MLQSDRQIRRPDGPNLERGAAGKEPLWRFSVEEILPFDPSAGSGQRKPRTLHERRRKGFTSLGALLAFIRSELAIGEEELFDDGTQ
jgi:hypothetical protein